MANTVAASHRPLPDGCEFDNEKKTLVVNNELLTLIYYESTDEMWMPIRTVMRIARETNFPLFLSRIHPDDMMSFKNLMAAKQGIPSEEFCYFKMSISEPLCLGSCKDFWLNENGFIKSLLSSHNSEILRWVTEEVFPLIRAQKKTTDAVTTGFSNESSDS